jgi:4-hydroxy-tetrahydrodipicolinate synthase
MTRKVRFLQGAFVPLVTPFRNGEIDYGLYAKLIERQIAEGSHGLLVNATSGEPTTLSFEEKARLIETAVKTSAHRRPVVAGTPAESHAETVALMARAERAGADAIVAVTPAYVKPPQRGLVAYFVDLAGRTKLPFLIYHIPGRAAVNLTADTIEAIAARAPNFVGLKNTDDNLALVTRLLATLGPDFRNFGGMESSAFAMSAIGGCWTMITSSNVAPRQIAQIHDRFAAGDVAGAGALTRDLHELMDATSYDTSPIPVKYMMKRLGILPANEHRLPMVPAMPELEKRLDGVLERAGMLMSSPRAIRVASGRRAGSRR